MIGALIRLTRPYYSLPLSGGLIVITSYLVAGDFSGIVFRLMYAFLSLYLILSGTYIFNDICDLAVDAINCPQRMLIAGKVSKKTAAGVSTVLFCLGILLAAFSGWRFFILMSLITAGLIGYDFYSKKMGIIKNVLVALLTTSLYPLAFTLADPAITPRVKVLFIHPVWLFMTTMGYEMLKDIPDMEGDHIGAGNPFALYRNRRWFILLARLLIVSASLITLVPFFLGYCNWIYFGSSIAAIGLGFASLGLSCKKAIGLIYAEVFLITFGSLVDLLVFGA